MEEDRPFELAALLAHVTEHPGGLDGDGEERRHEVEELEILVGEGASALVDRVADPDRLILDNQRDREHVAGVEQADVALGARPSENTRDFPYETGEHSWSGH